MLRVTVESVRSRWRREMGSLPALRFRVEGEGFRVQGFGFRD